MNLEKLMVMAFNQKIKRLDHLAISELEDPKQPDIPFSPDQTTIDRIKYSNQNRRYY